MAPVPFRKLSSYAIITEQTIPDTQAINRHQPNIRQTSCRTYLVQTNLTPLHRPITPTMAAPQVEQKSAKARQSEQGDVKEEGIGLLAMPDD